VWANGISSQLKSRRTPTDYREVQIYPFGILPESRLTSLVNAIKVQYLFAFHTLLPINSFTLHRDSPQQFSVPASAAVCGAQRALIQFK